MLDYALTFKRSEFGYVANVSGVTVTVTKSGRNWLAVIGAGEFSGFGMTMASAAQSALRQYEDYGRGWA